jgi:homogentisate phytyltransferase / homogentisate geranylgeranyltransferase
MIQKLKILWQFSRPHTIIGSTLSILSVYFLCYLQPNGIFDGFVLLMSLISALACNVYITGLNQWSDVEVDKINKPWLPIAAGTLSKVDGLKIVLVSGLISILSTLFFHGVFTALILLILGIGTAYSLPPLKFKRHHLAAAGAISLVRGLLVNVGFYLHFRETMTGDLVLDTAIWPLVIFVAAFSLGIAWFKDIPDTAGDAVHKFGTLAVNTGRKTAFFAGVFVVSAAYLFIIVGSLAKLFPNYTFGAAFHIATLLVFQYKSLRLDLKNEEEIKHFYMFFWVLFFAEYIVYPGLYI